MPSRAKLAAVTSLVAACLFTCSLWVARAGGAQAAQDENADKPGQFKLFREWTDTPDAVIVFSGQQHGYLEPCGCAPQFQKGGLARRAAFVNSLRQKKWPLALVDLGGILDDNTQQQPPGKFPIGQEQALAKLEIALEAMQHMGYTVVNFGPEELGVPNGFTGLMGTLINITNPPQPRLINANLEMKDQVFIEEGLMLRTVTRDVGKLKVGFVGIVGERHKDRLGDPEIQRWKTPDEVLPAAIKKLNHESKLQVLLLSGELAEAKRLAKKFPDLDVIVHGHDGEEPDGRPVWEGNTMLVTIGSKGKYTGTIGIFLKGKTGARFELVPLDDRFDEDKHIRELLDVKYMQKLAALQVVQNAPKLPHPNGPELSFVGVAQCKLCHPNVVKKWTTTPHAHALETLLDGVVRDNKKIAGGKQVNPECVNCHVTGFGFQSGFDGTAKTTHLAGNGCENCHGPASEHVAAYMNLKATKDEQRRANRRVHLIEQTPEKNLCARCHDAENDPAFELDIRWPEVEHGVEAGEDQKLWPMIRELLGRKEKL